MEKEQENNAMVARRRAPPINLERLPPRAFSPPEQNKQCADIHNTMQSSSSAGKDTIDGKEKIAAEYPILSEQILAASLQSLSMADNANMNSGITTEHSAASARRDVVTPPIPITKSPPELSPALMNALRGTGSPSYSQVSVGSANATPNVLHHKHYDLTPVMRNTSSYVDGKDGSAMPITPSDNECYLHGENLALPADLDFSSSDPPSIPPLQPSQRGTSANYTSVMTFSPKQQHQQQPPDFYAEQFVPIQFPTERRFHTFTTRDQYEEALFLQQQGGGGRAGYGDSDYDDDDDLFNASDDESEEEGIMKLKLRPYAPVSRPANFDIESLDENELNRIFSRREENSSIESSHQNHRLLNNAIPLDDRQFSIPSIHMAHHLNPNDTTSISYTENDDEDSLVRIVDDDASLSSKGSTGMLDDQVESLPDPDDAVVTALRRQRRKRKQMKKEQQAVEWLQSVEDSDGIAEAVSSKFLTGRQFHDVLVPSPSRDFLRQRRQSVPDALVGQINPATAVNKINAQFVLNIEENEKKDAPSCT